MLTLLVSVLLVAGAAGCGRPAHSPHLRVVNGKDAAPYSWPWQVSLQYERDGVFRHTCGGSLITPDWVMTAAHCISRSRTYKVVLGEYDLTVEEGAEQHIPINPEDIFAEVPVTGGWGRRKASGVPPSRPPSPSSGSSNDIALLKLSHRPELNDKVSPACMPPRDVVLPNEYRCYITGWGRISTGGPLSAKLQQAFLPVVDYEHCKKPDWWGGSVRESMVCAGGDIRSGCNGDSGGPLNCLGIEGRWYVHGIASFVSASGCNTLRKPTVFTRVSAFDEWIQQPRGTSRWPRGDPAGLVVPSSLLAAAEKRRQITLDGPVLDFCPCPPLLPLRGFPFPFQTLRGE
ncbi:chymotrypsin-like elastase family member 3B [Vipera latastei]